MQALQVRRRRRSTRRMDDDLPPETRSAGRLPAHLRRTPMSVRIALGVLGLLCLALALALASQYPLGAGPAVVGVLLAALLARYFWAPWPGWMLALVPLIGLAPWTGWLWLEELDLLVLASAAGGYLAWSGPNRQRPPAPQPPWRHELRWSGPVKLALLAWVVSVSVAAVLGLQDAGADPGWFDGYLEPGFSLRPAKTLLALLLMLPLWLRAARRAPQALTPSLLVGMALLMLGVAWGAFAERLAFTGLTNFSADYRTTSGFWEMHVGGAALDGALALSLPFVLVLVLRQQGVKRFSLAVALFVFGLYVWLTTFSRALYLGVLLGLALTALLAWRQRQHQRRGMADPASSWLTGQVPSDEDLRRDPWPGRVGALAMLGVAAWVSWQIFPSSGYRGLIGVCGAVVALLFQPPTLQRADTAQRALVTGLGLVLALVPAGLCALVALALDKSAYLSYVLAWCSSMVLAHLAWRAPGLWRRPLADALRAAAWYWTLAMAALVAWNWGGDAALEAAWLPLALLGMLWPMTQGGSLGSLLATLSWRTRVGAAGLLLAIGAVVAALGGGAYMAERFSTGAQDFQGRLTHWERALAIVQARQAWLFGVGAGRFVAQAQSNAAVDERVGDYRWASAGAGPRLVLAAGTHVQGHGELLRLTQRVKDAPAGLKLVLEARAVHPVQLHAELCQKHLLYEAACRSAELSVDKADWSWQRYELSLGGAGELAAGGWPKRELVFAVALATPGQKIELRKLSLRGADGIELLRNGDFSRELAHWFPSSDRHHMPFHMKSMPLHLLFEQGLIGLALATSLWLLALGRLSLGAAREHPLAPALAGALLGFAVVGLFDSLVDAARIAFLYYLLLALALGLRAPPPVVAPLPVKP